MTKTKADTYIAARLAGASDEEANAQAGYVGRTPGDALELYVHAQQVLEDAHEWGRGMEQVLREQGLCLAQVRRLEAVVREHRIKLDRLHARLKAIDHVVAYDAWKNRHASGEIGAHDMGEDPCG